jgi:hypothetical protein
VDVIGLAHAMDAETGTDLDPGALRRALRVVARGQRRAPAVLDGISSLAGEGRAQAVQRCRGGVLAEVFAVLELAMEQAKEACTRLAISAGIGVAVGVVDVYQDALVAGDAVLLPTGRMRSRVESP